MRAGRLLLALGVSAALAGCAGSQGLLDGDDFDGLVKIVQDDDVILPGATWCGLYVDVWAEGPWHMSTLMFDDGTWAAAMIVDRTADGESAAETMQRIDEDAARCPEDTWAVQEGHSIEPLDGLAEGELGWRTREANGRWGEYVLVPLDEWRFLAVGFETDQEQPPVDMDELVSRAKEGAARFPNDGG